MMITKWRLSENNWEYYGVVFVESENQPFVKMLSDGSCEMIADGVCIIFDEEIVQVEDGDGE